VGKQLGYWVGKPYWGQGFATEAATAVLDRYFTDHDEDVQSGYVDDNAASAAVLAKLGFEITGDRMLHIRSRGAEVPAKSVSLSKARWRSRA
jgi:RimJ/RimL family protein N-acetyltransferase